MSDSSDPSSSSASSRLQQASARGNDARAAIERARAGDKSTADPLKNLARRLVEATQAGTQQEWLLALQGLVDPEDRAWTGEQRMLFDLQKVCIAHERPSKGMAFWRWVGSFFRAPLYRDLPGHEWVRALVSLRAVRKRLDLAPGEHGAPTRLGDARRKRLNRLIDLALHDASREVRHDFGIRIDWALRSGGFRPRNAIERAALNEMTQTLLDQLERHGYVNIGHVRDAVANGNFKLRDIDATDIFVGDMVLRANCTLKRVMPGTYYAGEVYLRWLQTISSLLFGNVLGRLITLWLIIPLAGSYVALGGLTYLIDHTVHMPKTFTLATTPNVGVLAAFVAALTNWPAFRRRFVRVCLRVWDVLRWIFYDGPLLLLRLPWVKWLLSSAWLTWTWRRVLKPAALTAPLWFALPHERLDDIMRFGAMGAAFLIISGLLATKWGQEFEQWIIDGVSTAFRRLTIDVIWGALKAIWGFFRWLMEQFERGIYAVDEFFRYRGDGNVLTQTLITVGALLWSAVRYLIRLISILFVEPQINPIKHFPVVTVSHKVMLPTIPAFASAMEPLGYSREESLAAATTIIGLTPGIFGFLAWELRANWLLYEANRSQTLDRVHFGSHGESMRGMIKPGFHSGTITKSLQKIDKEKARKEPRRKRLAKLQRELHHAEEAVEVFIERRLLHLVNGHGFYRSSPISLGSVSFAPHVFEFSFERPGQPPLQLRIRHEDGEIMGETVSLGWVETISDNAEREHAELFVRTFWRLCGVDVVDGEELPSMPWEDWVKQWEG